MTRRSGAEHVGLPTMVSFTVPGEPVPASRPRVTASRGTYMPRKTRDAVMAVAWHARRSRARFAGPVTVFIHLYTDHRRGDLDNYAKTVLDGLEAGDLLRNDRAASELHVFTHNADAHGGEGTGPRTVVVVTGVADSAVGPAV